MTARAEPRTGDGNVLVVFVGLSVGLFVAALDQTILATALPTIVGELGGLEQYSWAVTAYLLTATASVPLYGKIGDLSGRKRVFEVALVILHVPGRRVDHRLDLVGAALIVGAAVAFLLLTVWGGQAHAWDSPVIVALAVAAVVLTIGFVAWERRVDEPLIPRACSAVPRWPRRSSSAASSGWHSSVPSSTSRSTCRS